MSATTPEIRTVVKERQLAHPPEKVWRALTEQHLIADWLMDNDFKPLVGHRFDLQAAWGSVQCEVLAVNPPESLSYSWQAFGLDSVVTWTLDKMAAGTRLRMEQTGFTPEQEQAYRGATAAWAGFLDRFEQVVGELEDNKGREFRA